MLLVSDRELPFWLRCISILLNKGRFTGLQAIVKIGHNIHLPGQGWITYIKLPGRQGLSKLHSKHL